MCRLVYLTVSLNGIVSFNYSFIHSINHSSLSNFVSGIIEEMKKKSNSVGHISITEIDSSTYVNAIKTIKQVRQSSKNLFSLLVSVWIDYVENNPVENIIVIKIIIY